MSKVPHSTIEQWIVLKTIIEEGGYVKAAEKLNRSQSSVSYTVSQLQKSLNVELLVIEGRRAVLTDIGHALLTDAIPIIKEMEFLESRSNNLSTGELASINLVIDRLFPKSRLVNALHQFSDLYPWVDISLREVVRIPMGALDDEEFDLAITITDASAKWSELLSEIPMLTVTSASHPLATAPQPIARSTLSRYPRIIVQSTDGEGENISPEGKTWRMNTIESAIEVIRHGIGFARLPIHQVKPYLDDHSLIAIDIGPDSERKIPLGLCFSSRHRQAPPALLTLAKLLGAGLENLKQL